MPVNPDLPNGIYSSSYLRTLLPEGGYLLVSPATEWIGWKGYQRIYTNALPYLLEAAKRFRAKTGRALTVLEAWRSYDTQVEYKRRQNAGTGNAAAAPGTSNHGFGVAFDLASGIDSWTSPEHKAFVEVATNLGFIFPLDGRLGRPNEPWHAEWDSSRVTSNDWAGSDPVPIDEEEDDMFTDDDRRVLAAALAEIKTVKTAVGTIEQAVAGDEGALTKVKQAAGRIDAETQGLKAVTGATLDEVKTTKTGVGDTLAVATATLNDGKTTKTAVGKIAAKVGA